ncbi:MAG: hypothetical protein ACFFDF_08635 [Candidatus Odinarchaeota archaeon]
MIIFEIIIGIFAGYCCAYFITTKVIGLTPKEVIEKWLKIILEKSNNH